MPARERDTEDCVKVLLEPRSLLVLQGDSRYNFSHAIRQTRWVQLPGGQRLRRGEGYRRVSLTFRGILKDQRTSQRQDTPEGYRHYVVRHRSATSSSSSSSSSGRGGSGKRRPRAAHQAPAVRSQHDLPGRE